MDKDIIRRAPAKGYERPEDRIPHEGEGPDSDPTEVRGASNQQLDLGSVEQPSKGSKQQ